MCTGHTPFAGVNNSNFFVHRNVFGMEDTPTTTLEKLVEYIRRELSNLDKTQHIIISGKMNWGQPPVLK